MFTVTGYNEMLVVKEIPQIFVIFKYRKQEFNKKYEIQNTKFGSPQKI